MATRKEQHASLVQSVASAGEMLYEAVNARVKDAVEEAMKEFAECRRALDEFDREAEALGYNPET